MFNIEAFSAFYPEVKSRNAFSLERKISAITIVAASASGTASHTPGVTRKFNKYGNMKFHKSCYKIRTRYHYPARDIYIKHSKNKRGFSCGYMN